MVYRLRYNAGLVRVGPEWVWRDFRLRLSHGRNHGSEVRLERAALVWAIYRNFTPAQCVIDRPILTRHSRLVFTTHDRPVFTTRDRPVFTTYRRPMFTRVAL